MPAGGSDAGASSSPAGSHPASQQANDGQPNLGCVAHQAKAIRRISNESRHRDRLARRICDLHLVAVAVGAGPDDGVCCLCQHGHAASCLLPGSGADVGSGLGGVTGWHNCDGSRPRADRLLTRSTRWARPGSANPGTGQMKGTQTAARSVASHPHRRHRSWRQSPHNRRERHSQTGR
jgi:hypothetical protein